MQHKFRLLIVLFLTTFLLPFATISTAESTSKAPSTTPTSNSVLTDQKDIWSAYLVPAEPNINAKGYVLMDAQSGKVIAAKNAHTKMPPASLTKLMTLYIVFNELAQGTIHLDDKVTISKHAWQTGGSRMFVKVGSKVPVKDLIQGVIVQSGNDATVALAEYVGGTESAFVQLMDQQAKVLGMKDSHFSDPTGLPAPDHLTTPYDLALLAHAIITNFPQYYHFFGEKWFTWNHIRQPNRNRLLWRNFNVDGLKTGHTSEAGYCLISSAKQNDTRFVAVVMGTPSDAARANDSQALLNYGFRFFQSAKIYNGNDNVYQQRVWKGEHKYIALGVNKGFYVTIPRRAYPDLQVSLTINPNAYAPIEKGQVLGTINVSLKGKKIATHPLVALQADPLGGWWTRFTDSIVHWFSHLFHKTSNNEITIGGGTK